MRLSQDLPSQDLGSLHVLDYRLYLSLRDWPWRGRGQSTRPSTQRDADEERSGAYR